MLLLRLIGRLNKRPDQWARLILKRRWCECLHAGFLAGQGMSGGSSTLAIAEQLNEVKRLIFQRRRSLPAIYAACAVL